MLTPGSQVLPGAVLVGSGGRGCEGLRPDGPARGPFSTSPYTAETDPKNRSRASLLGQPLGHPLRRHKNVKDINPLCRGLAETEGFEPSIGLYKPITV